MNLNEDPFVEGSCISGSRAEPPAPVTGRAQALLLDLDGTFYHKGKALPGAVEALAELRQSGCRLLFTTNTDSKTTAQIAARAQAMGLDVAESEIVSSVDAAVAFLRRQDSPAVHCLLPAGLAQTFAPFVREGARVDFVVVGDPRELDGYAALNEAFRHVMAGAQILALQKGRYFVTDDGAQLDSGAIVAALEYASGRHAIVAGKPSPLIFKAALARLGVAAADVVVVGDDMASDIAGSRSAGMRSVLVRTGKGAQAKIREDEPGPDWVLESVAELPQLLGEMG